MGSAITGWTVQFIGVTNLLLVCSGMLTTIVIFSWMLMHQCSLPIPTINRKQPSISWDAALAGARITLRSPYLLGVAAIVSCYEIVSTIIDYQFSFAVAKLFVQEEALASFLGKLGSGTVILAIFFQIFITTFILRRYGPKVGLFILPVIMALGSLIFLIFPFITFAAVLFASDNSLHYSVNQTSKEVLYTPTDEDAKYQAKAFIDMFISRFSKGFSSLIILICNLFLVPLGFQNHYLGILSLIIIIAWLVMASVVGSRFFELAKNNKG
jgi:AAA family ATP:ADP antiporter